MTPTFKQQIEQAQTKLFNAALVAPESYLQAMDRLICQLREKGASSREAQTAMQQLRNEWVPVLQEWEQTSC